MVLVRPVAELYALEQFVGDVRLAGGREHRREPVEARERSVFDSPRFDLARPTGDTRHAEAAFHDCALRGFEWRHATIRPSEYLSTVIGTENNQRVVRLADVVKVFQQSADRII